MTLIDTGPIVALLNRADPDHRRCLEALGVLTGPLLTTWPVITEAMHFLGKSVGVHGQQALWRMLRDEKIRVIEPLGESMERMDTLMTKYHDVPMDVADASLVVSAERLALARIFTLDGDFAVYRLSGKKTFVVLPEP
jgi:predicted nucleic acid-binding protein